MTEQGCETKNTDHVMVDKQEHAANGWVQPWRITKMVFLQSCWGLKIQCPQNVGISMEAFVLGADNLITSPLLFPGCVCFLPAEVWKLCNQHTIVFSEKVPRFPKIVRLHWIQFFCVAAALGSTSDWTLHPLRPKMSLSAEAALEFLPQEYMSLEQSYCTHCRCDYRIIN